MKNMLHHFKSSGEKESGMPSHDNTELVEPFILPKNSLTVIELFQSQGCSSCPPANDNVLKLVRRQDMLNLTYDVTYWDHLGWRDTFGNAAFEGRQRDYAKALGHSNVFTPQVVVNGRADGIGSTAEDLQSVIVKGDQSSQRTVNIAAFYVNHRRGITISGPTAQRGIVNVIRYDPRRQEVRIARGENSGRILPHGNIVRDVTLIGNWHGGKQEFMLPMLDEGGLKVAILIQAGPGGSIVGAACI